jgi:hypothetical protein
MSKLCGLLLLLITVSGTVGADEMSLTGDAVLKWREDLAILREQMPKTHGNLFHAMSRRQFDDAIDALEGSLPDATESQVKFGIMRLVAMVNDGHTRVRLESLGNHTLLARLHFFSDGLYVVAADKKYASIVGGQVKAIGLLSAEDAYAAVRQLVSVDADNEGHRRLLGADLLVIPEVLQAIGATRSANAVEFKVERGGHEVSAIVAASPVGKWNDRAWPMDPEEWVSARENAELPLPLWAKHPDKNYWHTFLDKGRTLYVQYNKVEDEADGEPISTYFPRIFREADERKVERVIIDVRLNGGGNNELNRPIWHALLRGDRLNRKNRLWVVIGPKTFSAAMNFVDDMEQNTAAIFVGEPTGESPNMWGDPVRLKLPNSGIVVQTSTVWWQMADPTDRRVSRTPDIAADMKFADYANNVDPVMKVIR